MARGDAREVKVTFTVKAQGTEQITRLTEFVKAYEAANVGLNNVLRTSSQVSGAASQATAALASMQEVAGSNVSGLVRQYNAATNSVETYLGAMRILAGKAASPYLGDAELADVTAGWRLANTAAENYSDAIRKLPPGIQALATAVDQHKRALREQASAQRDSVRETENAVNKAIAAEAQISRYQRVGRGLAGTASQQELQGDTAGLATTKGAMALADQQIAAYRKQLAGLTAEERALAQQVNRTNTELRQQADTARSTARQVRDTGDAFKQVGQRTGDLLRGLSSSVLSFSLIAGGMVAVGHSIGQVLVGAARTAEKFREAVQDITSLNPRLNTDQIFGQLTSLSERIGLVTTELAGVYKLAAQGGRGDEGDTLALTEEFGRGAQGARQAPAAWAEASTQTINAYKLSLEETARVQDVLTLAMQNSAGQGSKLLGVWGSVSKAAAGAQTPLEDNAAVMLVVARRGGDLEENMRALKGAYDALSTDKARAELNSMGIATTDAKGNVVSMMEILRQLSDRIGDAPSGVQDSYISQLFQDRDVRNVMRTLITSFDDVKSAQKEVFDGAGASGEAFLEYIDSAQGKVDRFNAKLEVWSARLGEFIDPKRFATNFMANMEQFLQAGSAPGLANIEKDLTAIISRTTELGGSMEDFRNKYNNGELFEITTLEDWVEARRLLEQYNNDLKIAANGQLTFNKILGDMVGGAAKGAWELMVDGWKRVSPAVQDAIGFVRQFTDWITEASDAAERNAEALAQAQLLYSQWGNNVLASGLSARQGIEGASEALNKVYIDSKRLTDDSGFGGFATAAEQELATLAKSLADTNAKILALQASISKETDPVILEKLQSELALIIGDATMAQERIEAIVAGIRAQSPEAKQAQVDWDRFVQQEAANEKIARSQEHVNNVVAEGAKNNKVLEDSLKGLQRQLRDNSGTELAAAYKKLNDETEKLKKGTKDFEDRLRDLALELRQVKSNSETALKPLIRDLELATLAASQAGIEFGATMEFLNDQLYDAEQNLISVRNTSKELLAPLVTAAEDAASAVKKLADETEAANRQFDSIINPLEDAIAQLERLRKTNLQPLRDEIQGLKDELRDLANRRSDELTPLEDALYGQAAALRDAEDAVRALSSRFAQELNPLQREYNALQREQQRANELERLQNQQLSIDNIAAQLANARAGTSEFIRLQEMMAKGRTQLGRDQRMFDLQNQIDLIEERRDVELQAAQERAQQARDEYEATSRQIELTRRRYELEQRAIEAVLRQKENDLEMAEREYDREIEFLRAWADGLKEQQRVYNVAQEAKMASAKADQEAADAALALGQAGRKVLEDAAEQSVTSLQTSIGILERLYEIDKRGYDEHTNAAKSALETEEGYWKGLIGTIETKTEKVQFDAGEFKRTQGEIAETAKTEYDKIRTEIGETVIKTQELLDKTREEGKANEEAAKKTVEEQQKQQDAIRKTWEWQNALNNAIKNGAVVAPGQLPSGVTPPQGYQSPAPPPGGQQAPPPGQGSGGPRGEPNPPPGGIEGMFPSNNFSGATMPVSASAVGGGVSVNGLSLVFQIQGGNMQDERYWQDVGEKALRGINTAISSRYGIRVSTEKA